MSRRFPQILALVALALTGTVCAQSEPATEPSVLAVAKAMPAVVNINTERVVQHTIRDPYDEFFNNFFGGPMRRPRVLSQKVQSLGSGFIVDPAGYIVTNEHVVQRAAELKISVTTSDGKTYNARYVAGSQDADLAFLKIDAPQALPFINLEQLSPNLLGETVLVLGNPLGYGSSVARGILSAKKRTVTVDDVEYRNLIQTDAAINPGNSGGPVVDIGGKLVGVSSVKMAFTPQGVPTQGLGFAIPGEVVRQKVEEFKKIAAGKKVEKPVANRALARKFFGLQLQDLTPELAKTLGYAPGTGVLIADVDEGSVAEQAGIKRGLVISQIGRYPVTSSKQIEDLLTQIDTGSVVDFAVGVIRRIRGQAIQQEQTISLTAR
ncbi:peptidase S1 and S6 chymotrypsin/Hap [Chthoniobacter flavus Ellin428]|uniref:Peptidase S1 and S6 chymotrypsin/Hap n=1 Tax=Chthoniobacter flavus Ellin428 TaxID=497964 RepID=B4D065_9BACT|nr:trypsin-like peptidase domain-containing protein [Chthoniobacter flavus]EDY20379.1 peptidase S1 and S6 chymotrypsin/Hap [Chthoniobacter flavus Ellin428]TCO94269.1 S1-C subfamily serine protease [Chthoniobacter flavus]